MTQVIKAADTQAAQVRHDFLERQPTPKPSPTDDTLREVEQALVTAQARERQMADEIARLKVEVDKTRQVAHAHGLEEGRKQAGITHDRQVAVIETAARQAVAMLASDLDKLRDLSIDMCLTALGRIVSTPEGRRDLIQGTVLRMIEQLATSRILSIEVSSRDFPDTATQALLDIGQLHGVTIDRREGAPIGTCKATLELGTVDLNLATQLSRLADLLESWKR